MVCDRLRQSIGRTTVQVAECSVSVTVSGGISAFDAEANAAAVVAAADAALYVAKANGCNRLEAARRADADASSGTTHFSRRSRWA
jgi:PleD family two-component response regulator